MFQVQYRYGLGDFVSSSGFHLFGFATTVKNSRKQSLVEHSVVMEHIFGFHHFENLVHIHVSDPFNVNRAKLT